MMKLTSSERQTLVGPCAIGCLLGLVVGLASWAFDSEYNHNGYWQMALNASVAFLASVAVATVPLGILPIVVRRVRLRRRAAAGE